MSKTLSTNVTNGKGGNSQPVWLVKMTLVAGTIFRWASPTTLVDGGDTYDGGRIKKDGIGSIDSSIRLENGGGVGTVGSFTLTLENTDLYSDTVFAAATDIWENAAVEVRLIFADQTTPSWANACPIYKGYISEISYDAESIELRCIDAWTKRHREILGDMKITAGEYTQAPDENIGKIIPVIYGDFWIIDQHIDGLPTTNSAWATPNAVASDHIVAYRIAPIPYIAAASANLLLCRHDLFQKPDNTMPANGRYLRIYDAFKKFTTILETGAGWGTCSYGSSRTTIANAEQNNHYLRLIPTVVYDYDTNVPDAGDAVDTDNTNSTTLGDGQDTDWVEYTFNFDDNNDLADADAIVISAAVRLGTGTPEFDTLLIGVYDLAHNLIDSDTTLLTTFGGDESTQTLATLTGLATYAKHNLIIRVTYTGTEVDLIYIKNLFATFTNIVQTSFYDQYYVPCQGRMYGAWIDSTYTNSHNANDLIETPTGIMESLLHDELGLTASTDVDVDAFDAMDMLRASWKFARDLLDAEESLDLIESLVFESGLGYVQDYQGKESVFRLDPTGSPATLGASVILSKGGKTALHIEKLKLSGLRNEFYLHYKKNYASGNFEKLLFVKSPEAGSYAAGYTNLTSSQSAYWTYCHNLYANLGIRQVWEYEAEWIRDDATAELFLKFMIEWLTFDGQGLRSVVKLTTALDTINLELGDQQHIDMPLLPGWLNADEYFLITRQVIRPNDNEIDLELLQIGQP